MKNIPNKKKRKVQLIILIAFYLIIDTLALISCFAKNDIISAVIFGTIVTFFAVMHLISINKEILNCIEIKNNSIILSYGKKEEIELSPIYGSVLGITKNRMRTKYRIFLEKDHPTNKNSYVFTDILLDKNEKDYLCLGISKIYNEAKINMSIKDRIKRKIKRLTTAST